MPEIFFDTRGEAGVENIDELMERFPKWAARAINSALASEGYRGRDLIRDAFDRGGPGDTRWDQLSPVTELIRRRKARPPKRRPKLVMGLGPSGKLPLLKFKGGIRYHVDKENHLLSMGFVNPSSAMEAMLQMHRKGYSIDVTRKMQKKMFAMGIPLVRRRLHVPARPLIEPVWKAEQNNIVAEIERKFFANLDRYAKE